MTTCNYIRKSEYVQQLMKKCKISKFSVSKILATTDTVKGMWAESGPRAVSSSEL